MLFCRCAVLSPYCFVPDLFSRCAVLSLRSFLKLLFCHRVVLSSCCFVAVLFCHRAVLSLSCFSTCSLVSAPFCRCVLLFACFVLSLQFCRIFFCRSSVLLTCSLPLLFCWCVASSRTVWSLSFLPLRCFPPRAVCRVLVCRTNSQMNERLRLPPIELAVLLHFRFIFFFFFAAMAFQPDFEIICAMPPKKGPCSDSLVQRWYHNPKSGSCEPFIYGGCGGNVNQFRTEAECRRACVKSDGNAYSSRILLP